VLLIAALSVACTDRGRSAPADVLVLSESRHTSAYVRNFNPLLEVGDVRWPARRAMYEPLMIHNPLQDRTVPWLATSYSWHDQHQRLRFTIRDGVRWSDGELFGAHDVVFTFELLRRHPALDLRGTWQFLRRVHIAEEGVVEFELSRPYVPGLFDLAHQPIVPKHIWQQIDDPVRFTNPNPVATGPYTEIESFQTQSYRVARNPTYWGNAEVRALQFSAFPGNEQANLALIRGEIDWAGDFVPAIDRVFVGRNPRHHHYWFPLIDTMVFLYANTVNKPLDDARVRKALSMAFDRELLVKVAMHGTTRPADATALNDAFEPFHSARAAALGSWTNHDPGAAAKLLDEAGLTVGDDGMRRFRGKRWSVNIETPSGYSDWVRAAQVITRGLRKVGVDARLKTYDFNAWYERIQKGTFTLSLGWSDSGPTPYHMFRGLMSADTVKPVDKPAPRNWHRFGLTQADTILEQLAQTSDKGFELYEQLQLLFAKHAPAIPLFPGPSWGEFNTTRITGFPSEDDPYAPLSPHREPQSLLVITQLRLAKP